MAGCLLDTHTLLWYAQGPGLLPAAVQNTIRQAAIPVYLSRVSLLEVAIKFGIGKLKLPDPLAVWLTKATTAGFNLLKINNEHLVGLATLPLLPNHRDPFDRLLIAQALAENLTLVSRDGKFAAYAAAGLQARWG